MAYVAYITAAVLAVLKLIGTVTVSWWLIVGIALIPFAILFVLVVFGALAALLATYLED